MIKANDTTLNIINIIQEGYRLPFLETLDTARFSNKKSAAINNCEFVKNSIKEILASGAILERDHPPPPESY